MNPESNPFKADPRERETVRRLSKTVLRAAERGRKTLFDTLTAQNAEKIARLAKQKPLLFEEKEGAPSMLLMEAEVREALPQAFFENPTSWIESRPNMPRPNLDEPKTIDEFWQTPYDATRVKSFDLALKDGGTLPVVSKRLFAGDLEEIARAREAYEAGIPTPRVVAEIVDQGNSYAWLQRVEAIDLNDLHFRPEFVSILHSAVLYPSRTKEDLEQRLATSRFDVLSKQGKKKLQKIIEGFFEEVHTSECLITTRGIALRKMYNPDRPIDDAAEYLRSFPKKNLDEMAQLLGYESFDALWKERPWDKNVEDLERRTHALHQEISSDIKKRIDEAVIPVISKDLFGFDLGTEVARLKSLCAEKGVEHKDFNQRNILINWDFKRDRPRKPKPGEPPLYLIDWESNPDDKKKT